MLPHWPGSMDAPTCHSTMLLWGTALRVGSSVIEKARMLLLHEEGSRAPHFSGRVARFGANKLTFRLFDFRTVMGA